MFITADSLLYSKAAAARILRVDIHDIEALQIWGQVIWVKVDGQRPQFMSKRTFRQHFVDWRKTKAQSLQVTQQLFKPNTYTAVLNHSGRITHTLVQSFHIY